MKCIVVDDNLLAQKTTEQFINKLDNLELRATFDNPVNALSYVSENEVDLVFLDIEMPEMNGIEFINALKHPHPLIILTTTHKDYAPEAFENNVADYLVKPINLTRFVNAVNKAKKLVTDKQTVNDDQDSAFVKKGNSIVKINISDVIWIESLGDYVSLCSGAEKYVIYSTMQDILKKFPKVDFIRVHRSFIVRISKIESIEDDVIQCGDKLIPIGKTYRQEVFKRLNLL